MPTLLGYSAQGACKFGFYEYFKKYYSDIAGPEYAAKYKTLIYLAGSASAEVIADVALCPMEAVKVRVQTQPGFARGLSDGFPKFVKSEGALGYVSFFFLVTTSTSPATSSPNCLRMSSTVYDVSSTTSCRKAVMTLLASSRSSLAAMRATLMGCRI